MRTRTTAAAAALLLAALTACQSSSDGTTSSKPSGSPATASERASATGNAAQYDAIWKARSPETQKTVCDLLAADGPEAVSFLLGQTIDDPSVDMVALAEYINDEKC